jgi:hypothetical protein
MVTPRAFPNWVGLSISSFNARLIHFFRIFLHRGDIKFKLLRESTSYFGYNPCRCFDASRSVIRLEAKKQQVLRKIKSIAGNTSHIVDVLILYQLDAYALYHTIFQLSPENELRQLETCHCDVVSQWVFDSLLDACETHEANAAARFYRQLSGSSWAASFQGRVFERWMLK